MRLAAHQGLDQVVPPRVSAICRHPRDTGATDHVLDRNTLQPNGCRLGQRSIEDALACPVGRFVDPTACACATDDLDELGIDHDVATLGRTAPAARCCASCR